MYMYISTLAKIVSCGNLSQSSVWLFREFRDFSYVAERFDQSINEAWRFYECVSGIVETKKLGSPPTKKPIDPHHPPVLQVLSTEEN